MHLKSSVGEKVNAWYMTEEPPTATCYVVYFGFNRILLFLFSLFSKSTSEDWRILRSKARKSTKNDMKSPQMLTISKIILTSLVKLLEEGSHLLGI